MKKNQVLITNQWQIYVCTHLLMKYYSNFIFFFKEWEDEALTW